MLARPTPSDVPVSANRPFLPVFAGVDVASKECELVLVLARKGRDVLASPAGVSIAEDA